ncbi:MAG: response regulator [Anaerolineae bacterium]|nr:response regulator [Anaerolineae bacterium]MCB0181392.1 response regulator [Anaerolineae bacterium]MCB0223536.1 response regulator [Anaerolineae bacterium]MCB9105129.1 response regulator [Anaerolineales bacterium]
MMNNPQTILIIDDEQDNLRLLVNILKNQTYGVRPIRNAYQGLMIAQQETPDLILLDIKMPEMDGYEICRRLKADEQTRDIPIIFLSALDDVGDKLQAFQVGGVDYVSKPFQEIELLARIETHLTLRHLQQALQTANETLEDKVQLRTAELAEVNHKLQAEIERRIQHQHEKDNLFGVVSQQSEQVRNLTTWLIESQQSNRQGLASNISDEMAHRIALLRTDLTVIKEMSDNDADNPSTTHLENALQILTQMESYVTQITTDLLQPTPQEEDISNNPLIKLSEREREVLQLLVQGKSGSDIADIINIAPSSVHTYSRRIRTKLDLPDLPSLVKFAIEHHLID